MADMMARLRVWLRPPRNLLVLFAVVTLLPAATLAVLGVRLLQQDRALAEQRRSEMLEHAADRAVRAVEQDMRLAHPPPQRRHCSRRCSRRGGVRVSAPGRIDAVPAGRAPYYPDAPGLLEPPAAPFDALEALEFRNRIWPAPWRSLEMLLPPSPLVRAGALLRQARILRKMGRSSAALETYRKLEADHDCRHRRHARRPGRAAGPGARYWRSSPARRSCGRRPRPSPPACAPAGGV